MKTRKKTSQKSANEQLRAIRDKISLDIQDMNFEQLKKYVEKRLILHPSAWKKVSMH